jgi:hypothetical protein
MPNKTSTTSTKTKAEPKAQAAETPNADDVLSTYLAYSVERIRSGLGH